MPLNDVRRVENLIIHHIAPKQLNIFFKTTRPISSAHKIWSRFNSVLHSQKVLDLLVLCIIINLCLECFHCHVIIDCWLTLISCTFQPMVALIYHLLSRMDTAFARLPSLGICDICRGLEFSDPSSLDLEFGLARSLNSDDFSPLDSIASTTLP